VGDSVALADDEEDGDGKVESDDAALSVPDAVAEDVEVAVADTLAVFEPDVERLGVGEGEADTVELAVELLVADTDTDTVPLGEKVGEGEALDDEKDELVADAVDEPVLVLDDVPDRDVEGDTVGLDDFVALEVEDAVELEDEVGGFGPALHVKTTSPFAGAAA
jgi:hypothetical protein